MEPKIPMVIESLYQYFVPEPLPEYWPDYLQKACDILLETLPGDRPCGVARSIGREGEGREIMTLAQLRDFPADMFCTAFVGNSQTRVTGGELVTPRGYRDV